MKRLALILAVALGGMSTANAQLAYWSFAKSPEFYNFAASDIPDIWGMTPTYRVELVCVDRQTGVVTELPVDPAALTVVDTPTFGIRTWAIRRSMLPARPRNHSCLIRVINLWSWTDDAGNPYLRADHATHRL